MDDPTIAVHLTLEETGTLCHLIMGAFVEGKIDPTQPLLPQIKDTGSTFITRETVAAVLSRQLVLYKKLSDSNDILMGKKPRPKSLAKASVMLGKMIPRKGK